MEQIKLYVGENYREPTLFTHVDIVFPIWGVAAKESMPYVRAASLKYQFQEEDFMFVDTIKDADFVVVPYQYDRLRVANPSRLDMILEEARRAGKPVLIDGSGDIEHPIDIPNSSVMRVSQYSYSVEKNDLTVPFPTEDLLEIYGNGTLPSREKPQRAKIGFTGWANVPFLKRMKIWVKEIPLSLTTIVRPERGAEHKGILFRERALASLSSTKDIETNFTARSTYSGHVKTIQGTVKNNREEFVANLRESDYALCVKGDANSSVRFYEALSMGCIPVFLDTACVLPLEDVINYRDFCVFVDWRDVDSIGQKLSEFHDGCTPERFQDMKKKARSAYRNHLRIDAFSKDLARQLRARVTRGQ